MAVYDLEEQEQISQIKAWWEQYGKFITALLVTAAVASIGWQGFKWYQNKQATEASALYFQVQQAADEGDAARVREAAGRLIESHPRSAYAQMGALMSAGVQFAEGDGRNARAHLEWLVANGRDPLLKDIARLRLATILFDEGEHADALTRLEPRPDEALVARFADLRGDVLVAEGKPDEARAAYRSALDVLARQPGQGADALAEIVRIKLESLEAR